MHLEVGHLVLDHVVEDLRRGQQQAPVEAHRAPTRSSWPSGCAGRGSAGACSARRPGPRPRPGAGRPRARARRRYQRSSASRSAGPGPRPRRAARRRGAPRAARSRPGSDAHAQAQALAQVGHLAAVLQPRRRLTSARTRACAAACARSRGASRPRTAPPRAAGSARGTTTSTPSAADDDAGVARPVGAPDAVGNRSRAARMRRAVGAQLEQRVRALRRTPLAHSS